MTHHGEGLRRLTRNPALVAQLKEDYRAAPLSPADRAMLDYAAKLTREPWTVREGDVQALRETGFSDADILDIAQVTAYFAYVNRIADGLGVAVEAEKWEEIRVAQQSDSQ
ncbi:MAG: peroxidase-related enzyme [Chloroflexi bacterium]|nr:peroxidase-related enzyme [Chloroflexota bacterium]